MDNRYVSNEKSNYKVKSKEISKEDNKRFDECQTEDVLPWNNKDMYSNYLGNTHTSSDCNCKGCIGPKGDKGDQGIQGIKGDTGNNGEKGDTGATGPQGPVGPKGDTGAQGVKGEQGLQGVKGDIGPMGRVGPQGLEGPKGEQGLQGVKGDKGDIGLQGIQGVQGVKGDTGATGPQGPVGPKGDTGEKGVRGEQGLQGVKGDKGDIGLQGIQGVQGVKGDTGATGPQGPVGPKGDTGEKGLRGEQGLQGVKGDRGDIGPKGDTGSTGPQGPAGPQGPQGATGPKGDSASCCCTPGPVGPQGIQGVQGSQGIQGKEGKSGSSVCPCEVTFGKAVKFLIDNGFSFNVTVNSNLDKIFSSNDIDPAIIYGTWAVEFKNEHVIPLCSFESIYLSFTTIQERETFISLISPILKQTLNCCHECKTCEVCPEILDVDSYGGILNMPDNCAYEHFLESSCDCINTNFTTIARRLDLFNLSNSTGEKLRGIVERKRDESKLIDKISTQKENLIDNTIPKVIENTGLSSMLVSYEQEGLFKVALVCLEAVTDIRFKDII